MTTKLKMAIKILVVVLVMAITSFITHKFNDWFPPATEIRVVFDDCVFSEVPLLRPVKDQTYYYFKGCKMNGQDFGETISNTEVDEAIAKLDEKENKK